MGPVATARHIVYKHVVNDDKCRHIRELIEFSSIFTPSQLLLNYHITANITDKKTVNLMHIVWLTQPCPPCEGVQLVAQFKPLPSRKYQLAPSVADECEFLNSAWP